MSPEVLMIFRFVVATAACAITYVALLVLLNKFEGGLYLDHEVPFPPMDGPHKRARRTLYKCISLVLVVVSLLGLLAYKSIGGSPTWSNVCWPALGGAWFSLLYAALMRNDQVRPRQN